MSEQDDRQVRLREHARRLIAETRARSHHMDSPTSPIRLITQRITLSPERSTISPIHQSALADGTGFFGSSDGTEHPTKENTSPSKRLSGHLQQRIAADPLGTATMLIDEAASRRGSPSSASMLGGIGKNGLSERNGNTPLTDQQQLRASPQREKKVCVL